MKISLNFFGLTIVIALILASFYFGNRKGQLKGERALNELSDALKSKSETLTKYQIQIDSVKEYVSQLEYVKTSNQRIIRELNDNNKRLNALNIKNVNLISDLNIQVDVLEKKLEYKEPPIIIKSDSSNCLQLPVELSFSDKYAYNNISIDSLGNSFADFGIKQSEIHIIVGDQKESLFKSKVGVLAVTTDNPYLKLDPHQVILTEKPKRWYNRKVTYLLGGLVVGYFILP